MVTLTLPDAEAPPPTHVADAPAARTLPEGDGVLPGGRTIRRATPRPTRTAIEALATAHALADEEEMPPALRVEKTREQLVGLEPELAKLIHDGDPAVAAEARLTLAGLYADLAQAIADTPIPEDTPPNEREAAMATLDREASGLRDKAATLAGEVPSLLDAMPADDPRRAEFEARLAELPQR